MLKELLRDSFPIIEKSAPAIASMVSSPFAGASTMLAINLIGHAFGVNPSDLNKLNNTITENNDAHSILADLEEHFGDWFKNNSTQLRMPYKAEFNVKLEWNNNPS